MARFSLIAHPDRPPLQVRGVACGVARVGDRIVLDWRVEGAGALIVPPPAAPVHTDGLWQTTCFEAFLALPGTAYAECNLAPSGAWAAYGFADYRDGMAPRPLTSVPQITALRQDDAFACRAVLAAADWVGAVSLGLTAVIAEEGGHTSYWALAHAAGKPDFHQRSCFTAAIEAALRP
ncbi:hypothetical protein GTZ99_06950 [Novosphingobium sp. FSY-8]|uniref:DOMON-like domain-containing protein n=1 Tax=Novosphingobium ovatum TaxID=1908523 RepID=A0ABW9XCP4_9SPHN|nr:DOMON-like domain-containing protein [Novosphingobium ovatum]NBC36295.1 hypothetical protein [Novosphingobium ovatum]